MAERYDPNKMLDYLEGDLSPAQLALFERQLRNDPQLAALAEQLRQDQQLLHGLEPQLAPDGLMDPVNERTVRQMLLEPSTSDTASGVGQRAFRLRRLMTWSAVAAVLVLSASAVWMTSGSKDLWWPRHREQYAFDQPDKPPALEPRKADDSTSRVNQQAAQTDAAETAKTGHARISHSGLDDDTWIDKEPTAVASTVTANHQLRQTEPTEPVHLQIQVTTDDAKVCTTMLLEYAAKTNLTVHMPISDGQIDLECSGDQLTPLLIQLNAPAHQSAQLVRHDHERQTPDIHGAQAFVQNPVDMTLEKADTFVEMQRQWRTLLDQQVLLMPVKPVYDFEPTLKLQVTVRQTTLLDVPMEADVPQAPQP